MTREEMIESVYAKTDLDFDQIEALNNSQLMDLLGLKAEEEYFAKPENVIKAAKPLKIIHKPKMTGYVFQEQQGALYRVETWMTGDIEQTYRVRCGNNVKFEGRTVSAGIVLHWLRTGDLVKRLPKPRKIKAAIRVGDKVKHLGYFSTREECEAAILMYKLSNPKGLS